MKNNPLLVGMKDIMERFSISEDQFYMFLGLGLPLRKINGRWYGHIENIDAFLRKATIGPPANISSKDIKKKAGNGQ
jgi:hypothetical protein